MKFLMILTLIGASISGPVAAEEFTVTMAGANYSPASISGSIGDTIRFVNDDGADHNVFVATAAHALDFGKQEPGSETELVLRSAGNFDVECVFHPHMQLKVEIGS